jgi:2-hydroxychromene-2-carboxylate isomerase
MSGVKLYVDTKSPYAYLAKDLVYAVERETGAHVDWLPYTLDIPAYLGHARLDDRDRVIEDQRNAHQWRRVRYSYMDCRREAARRGLSLRGPRRIFDSSLANVGMLHAKRRGRERAYLDCVFTAFFQRALELESEAALTAVLEEIDADPAGFAAYARDSGRAELAAIQREAEAAGVFGVPSFLFPDGDLYWGREHLARVRERLLGGSATCSSR